MKRARSRMLRALCEFAWCSCKSAGSLDSLTRRTRRTRSWYRLCLGCHANLGNLWKVSRRGVTPRITGISRNVYIRHTRTFYFLNTNFSNCTNAFPKKILRDPCDTWRLVSGVSRVSHGMFILGSCES